MTIAIGTPHLAVIAGTTYKQLLDDFMVYSDVLKTWLHINAGFVYDEESTPWKGENPIAGLIHDYLSRSDSIPIVTKDVAAQVYYEFQKYEDSFINKKKSWFSRAWDCVWRYLKAGTVAVVPDCVYWHKFSVRATYEEITA